MFSLRKLLQKGTCSICDHVFYEFNLKEVNSLFLCPLHFKQFKRSSFVEFSCCESTAQNPNNALFAQELKEKLLSEGFLSYITSSYIEIDGVIHSRFTIYKSV